MGRTGNISPFPNILLTPLDACPLKAPVANGATTFEAIYATVGRTVLAKKDARAPRNSPFLHCADICFLLIFISTPVLSSFSILFICVFVNNNGKFPLSLSSCSLIVIGDLFLYALAKFALCPSVKLTEYD